MHFQILIEDKSGKKMLDILVPKIIDTDKHTFRVRHYEGLGHIPKNTASKNIRTKKLLNNLPKMLKAYGKEYASPYSAAVIVVCDLDNQCLKEFLQSLHKVLDACSPKPETRFCIAIEESEAWLLGDISAVEAAYPKAQKRTLNNYQNDSICGTWEVLADAVYTGGSSKLSKKGWPTVGTEKSKWAKKISPHMTVSRNQSPSFNYFQQKLCELAQADA